MGSEVSDDLVAALRELVANHGAEQVRKALNVATKRKPGPRKIEDIKLAVPFLELEGLEWLLGADLLKRGRQAQMARRVLEVSPPQHSEEAGRKRLEAKLRKIRVPGAIMLGLVKAVERAPLSLLIDKLAEALDLAPAYSPIIGQIVGQVDDAMLLHRKLIGEPDPEMSLRAIVDACHAKRFRGLGSPLSQ